MKPFYLSVALLLPSFALATTNTNTNVAIRIERELPLRSLPATNTFGDRLNHAFQRRADQVSTDMLNPFNTDQRFLRYDSYEQILDKKADIGVELVSRSFVYSGREVALDAPFFVVMKESPTLIGRLFRGSVGNVEEEQLKRVESPDFAAEVSWWNRLKENGNFRYGVRPLRYSPYAFAGFAYERHHKAVLFGNVRYYCHHFSDHQFDVVFSVPIDSNFMLDIGLMERVKKDGTHDHRYGAKLFKRLSQNSMVFIGASVRDSYRISAGFYSPW